MYHLQLSIDRVFFYNGQTRHLAQAAQAAQAELDTISEKEVIDFKNALGSVREVIADLEELAEEHKGAS